jgi:hypothetical protein
MSLPKKHLAILMQADGSATLGSADVPKLRPDEVLVKIDAAAQNPSDPSDCAAQLPCIFLSF